MENNNCKCILDFYFSLCHFRNINALKPPISNAVPIRSETSMQLTNQEFFKASMYFTDEVKLRLDGQNRFVNEFLVCNNIGRGSYSKVKRVIRLDKLQLKKLHEM